MATLAGAIGMRVKSERRARGLTLDQLAATAAVSRRMLINVEQGVTNPSVGTLLRISEALGVPLPALVAPPQPKPMRITRRGEGAVLWSGARGGRGTLVAAAPAPDVLELWDWSLAPGDRHTSEPHPAGTRELLQVQENSITVDVAGQSFALDEGDALAFPGDEPHSYSNPGSETARFSLAVLEPASRLRTGSDVVGA